MVFSQLLAKSNLVFQGDNLEILPHFPEGSVDLIYIDPPYNTGKVQTRRTLKTTQTKPTSPVELGGDAESGDSRLGGDAELGGGRLDGDAEQGTSAGSRKGFGGRAYYSQEIGKTSYDDKFEDYPAFIQPRLAEAHRLLADSGTLYLHLDYREAHYCKILLDQLFGRANFINEIIWAYDFGARQSRKWATKHDTILMYVKNPQAYYFDQEAVERIPYMAPGLVTPEKAKRGKLPTDVWWHTIVPTVGKEKTGYATQKPEGIIKRIVKASSKPGDLVLDFFAGSGTVGSVCQQLDRQFVLIDNNPEALSVMATRLGNSEVVYLDAKGKSLKVQAG